MSASSISMPAAGSTPSAAPAASLCSSNSAGRESFERSQAPLPRSSFLRRGADRHRPSRMCCAAIPRTMAVHSARGHTAAAAV
eukprot:5046662-Alexandrium_andersonii.AAC.1